MRPRNVRARLTNNEFCLTSAKPKKNVSPRPCEKEVCSVKKRLMQCRLHETEVAQPILFVARKMYNTRFSRDNILRMWSLPLTVKAHVIHVMFICTAEIMCHHTLSFGVTGQREVPDFRNEVTPSKMRLVSIACC